MPTENMDTMMFVPCKMNCEVCEKHRYLRKPCAGCLNRDKGNLTITANANKRLYERQRIGVLLKCLDHPCKLIKNLKKRTAG